MKVYFQLWVGTDLPIHIKNCIESLNRNIDDSTHFILTDRELDLKLKRNAKINYLGDYLTPDDISIYNSCVNRKSISHFADYIRYKFLSETRNSAYIDADIFILRNLNELFDQFNEPVFFLEDPNTTQVASTPIVRYSDGTLYSKLLGKSTQILLKGGRINYVKVGPKLVTEFIKGSDYKILDHKYFFYLNETEYSGINIANGKYDKSECYKLLIDNKCYGTHLYKTSYNTRVGQDNLDKWSTYLANK